MLIADPFAHGIAAFGSAVRSGETSFEQATLASLSRIQVLEPSLNAFEQVDTNRAIEAAIELDRLLASGTDLGPLMGVTVAVKDIIAVDGLPTTNGSNYAPAHLKLSEGTLIQKLRAAGCVLIGKTKTVEFALGATGINQSRGTPWNPWDAENHRIPGGSSSGSAVAVAAGLCGFALGTDTGGSIRIPASYNGLTGLKTTVGLWPTDGVFPLCATFDSVGPLCHCAEDAQLIHRVVTSQPTETIHPAPAIKGLRLGIPKQYFCEDLDTEVHDVFINALEMLKSKGVTIVDIDLPEAADREKLMPPIMGAEIIDALTADGFQQAYDGMDPVTRSRAAIGLEVKAHEYVNAKKRVVQLQKLANDKCANIDALVSATCPMLAPRLDQIEQSESVAARALLSSKNTQPANMFGMCATTLPIQQSGLPVGFQIMMPGGEDNRLLAISAVVQRCLWEPLKPVLDKFVRQS